MKKSSLLKTLTGLPFPSASDLCTRFATQVVLRRGPASEASVSISIIPGPAANADNEVKKKLVGFVIFCKQTSKWKTISEVYLTKVMDAVTDYNDSALKEFVIDNDIRRKLLSLIEENAQVTLEEANMELNSILQAEQGGVLETSDQRFNERLSFMRYESMIAMVMQGPINNEVQAVNDIHDILKAYYKTSLTRFIDNIVIQVVERRILGEGGPLRVFTSEFVDALSDEDLSSITMESSATAAARMEASCNGAQASSWHISK